jgi:hypothetical protein
MDVERGADSWFTSGGPVKPSAEVAAASAAAAATRAASRCLTLKILGMSPPFACSLSTKSWQVRARLTASSTDDGANEDSVRPVLIRV